MESYQDNSNASKFKAGMKKALPWIALLLGLILVYLLYRNYVRVTVTPIRPTGALVGEAPMYDQFQNNFAPSADSLALHENPASLGYSFDGSILPAPVRDCPNGSCNYPTEGCPGGPKLTCQDSGAVNYDPTGCPSINSCVRPVIGCLDPNNQAYNAYANTHDQRFCVPAQDVCPL